MKKVLFHSLTIPPDQVSTGKLVADIASKFKDNNINVEILASTPQYLSLIHISEPTRPY